MKKFAFILMLILMFVLIISSFAGCSHEMTADELKVVELVSREKFGGVSDAEQAEYVDMVNNGYKDYRY